MAQEEERRVTFETTVEDGTKLRITLTSDMSAIDGKNSIFIDENGVLQAQINEEWASGYRSEIRGIAVDHEQIHIDQIRKYFPQVESSDYANMTFRMSKSTSAFFEIPATSDTVNRIGHLLTAPQSNLTRSQERQLIELQSRYIEVLNGHYQN